MSSDKIVLGQIGYGYWGSKLFKYLSRHPGFEIAKVVVSNLNKKRVGLENTPITNSVAELLSNPQIETVVIATPLSTHYLLAKQVLESGRHLFIEKIFTEKAEEGRELKTIAERKELKILVDYTFMFSAAIAQMRTLIEKGEIGEPAAFYLSMLQLGRFGRDDVYKLLGSHMLSILNLFIPLNELNFQRHDYLFRNGVVESGMISFTSRSTLVKGTIMVSLNHPVKERKIIAYGDKGTIIYDMLAKAPLHLTSYKANQQTNFLGFSEKDNLALAVSYFYDLLHGLKPSNVTDAILISEVLDKIRG